MHSLLLVVFRLLSLVAVCGLGVSPVACGTGPATAALPESSAAKPATAAPTPTPVPRPHTGKVEAFAVIPAETMLTYTVTQVLLNEAGRSETVVGRTRQVAGQFTLNYHDPAASSFGQIAANLNTLSSGNPERDEALRSAWLEFARFPLATFLVQEVRGFPDDFRPTEPANFQLLGDLTLKGVSQPAIWDATATLYLDRLKGTATTFVKLSDFGIPLPGVPGLIQVMDGVTVTLEFTFKMVEPPPPPGGA